MLITKQERNAILRAIQSAGLDPGDFEPPREAKRGEMMKELETVVVIHKPTRSSFAMGPLQPALPPGMRMVATTFEGKPAATARAKWLGLFEKWLAPLVEWQRDNEQPDLWAQFETEREAMNGATASDADNARFTTLEKAEIAAALNEFAGYAKRTYELSAEASAELDSQLKNLAGLTARLGKRDWLTMAAGVCVVLQTILPAGASQHLFGVLLRAVGHLLGAPPHLGLPGG